MIWMLPLAGAALGAMASKKDPLKGALMGAALGATGGAVAPGLLGAGAGSATTAGALAGDAFMPAALGAGGSEVALGAAIPGMSPAGYTATGLLGQAGEYAKPAMQGLQAASQVQGLLGGEPTPKPPPMQQRAPLDLSSILQANQQSQMSDMEGAQRRQKELEMYAANMMGGR